MNATKCISYQTIENRGEIDKDIIPKLSNNIYGCDICQLVCPWNKHAKPHNNEEFAPSEEFLALDAKAISKMTQEQYSSVFKKSAIKRAKFSGLQRNFEAWSQWKEGDKNKGNE